jgi:hypothetical protein
MTAQCGLDLPLRGRGLGTRHAAKCRAWQCQADQRTLRSAQGDDDVRAGVVGLALRLADSATRQKEKQQQTAQGRW